MVLSFSTKWPDRMRDLAGQPNYFIEKIWSGFEFDDPHEYSILHNVYNAEHKKKFGQGWDNKYPNITRSYIQKLHTIREDKHDRWKPGMKIHPVINNRTKDRFQFAPVLRCKSVQDIEIEYLEEIVKYCTWTNKWAGGSDMICVYIDGKMIDSEAIEQLALNDGFPSVEAFFQYFNQDFKGKLIHWTDLKY